jgi:hypothetical protein
MSDLMMQHLKRVTDLCEEKTARIAALEAQNKKLVEALTFIKNYDNYATDGDLQVSDTEVTHVSNYAESVLSEVTK